MKQKLQLQIPEPCHENWNNMTETQQGRFCMCCQKEVIDFSVMTDKEIRAYISTTSSNMCGRVQDDQLNRFIQAPHELKQHSFKYFWSILITSFLISNKSSGQVRAPKDTIVSLPVGQTKGKTVIRMGGISTIRNADETKWQIIGRVVDEHSNPLPYASVTIKGTTQGVATDSEGLFSIMTKGNLDKIELIVSSVGYTTQTLEFNKSDQIKSLLIEDGTIKMSMADISLKAAILGEVVVKASEMSTRRMGGMVAFVRYTSFEKMKNKLLGTNEVKVYPNPIAINSVFNIRFNLKDQGRYALQFTDPSGKVIAARQLNISSKNQLENFNGDMFNGSGIYFVSVTSKQNMKTFTTKLLVQ